MKIPENANIKPIDFPEKVDGMCMKKGDEWCIGYHKDLEGSKKNRVIAHELGHCIDDTCGIEHPLAEKRATKIGNGKYILPKEELKKVIEEGYTSYNEILSFFSDATVEIIEKAVLEIYDEIEKNKKRSFHTRSGVVEIDGISVHVTGMNYGGISDHDKEALRAFIQSKK